ncbi:hypothetical protein HPB51_023687 [Rhipicephalus microplus]|uniref:Soluble epoxide hydrolase n=1 Tax=Rhipicephalus microplus TaxID=6941 RepID=A0A9J6E3P6_RHIMP|nr:hypothetical protein HPB51_023687 [Rhipicephalus microplus]
MALGAATAVKPVLSVVRTNTLETFVSSVFSTLRNSPVFCVTPHSANFDGALTGVLNYYRAFNFDSDQFTKLNYRKIRVPTLILWSEKDRFLTTPIAEFNREHLKRSFVVYYPEGGHWLMRQCADSVNNHIIEFASTGRIIYNESMAQSQIRLAEFSCAESPKLSKKS